jgi:hypothetical protein
VAAAKLKLTRTHGFFMIMGGFHSFTGSAKGEASYEPKHPIRWDDVIPLLENETIDLPTEREIQDKSTSDWLAKTVVLIQTIWFITQCIARRIEHLPTTELEIVALAYTTINFGIFLAWLDKPQNVECPIRVFHQPPKLNHKNNPRWFSKVMLVIMGGQDDWVNLHEETKVPLFYSGGPTTEELGYADSMTLAAGVVFGAIHCIAWSFEFATPVQAWLWRSSAIVITAIPVLLLSLLGFLFLKSNRLIAEFLTFSSPPLSLLYITARLITVVLAFINLTSLPPGAYETVHWTTLLPHV